VGNREPGELGVGNRNTNKQSQRPKVHLHNFPARELGLLGAPLAAKSKASRPVQANKKTKKTLKILLMRSTLVRFPVHTRMSPHTLVCEVHCDQSNDKSMRNSLPANRGLDSI